MPLKLKRYPGRSRHWYIRGTVKGKAVFESAGTASREHAEYIKAQREKELLDSRTFGPKATATFLEAAVSYMETHSDHRFIGPLLGHFGDEPLRSIGQRQADAAAAALYPGRKPSTLVRQLYTPLIAILNHASKGSLCDRPNIEKPKVKRRRVRAAGDQWIGTLCEEVHPRLKALILFMTTTGARISEACRLEVEDVDLPRGEAILNETKSGNPRRVPLPPVTVAAMANIMPQTGRVFGYKNRSGVYNALKRACKRAGIPYYSTHPVGRHAFSARLLREGATLKELQEAGGWADIRIVAEIYGHLERNRVDDIVRSQNLCIIREDKRASGE